jgi:hypothetical protein
MRKNLDLPPPAPEEIGRTLDASARLIELHAQP